jgi:hypothetical protein
VRFLLVGLVVPHAPVLLSEVRGEADPIAIPPLHMDPPDCAVLLSPHGASTGVYRSVAGDLAGFGVTGLEVSRQTDAELSARLAERWGQQLLDEPCDHGVVVPLLAGWVPEVPVVACTLEEVTGPDAAPVRSATEAARAFAAALAPLTDDRAVMFVASAHTSAALTPRAPLTLRDEGLALDREIKDALETDLGELDSLSPELWTAGGACGVGPLTALGLLFKGSKAEVPYYDHPFGVGYLLAEVA